MTPPAGGTVDASVTTYQSVATFSCNTGYTLQGSDTLTCQDDTTWDNAPPTCQINGIKIQASFKKESIQTAYAKSPNLTWPRGYKTIFVLSSVIALQYEDSLNKLTFQG